ncbi:hypothetical protein M427DRAFT_39199 [Gonapodya prolifera JEL478]|uniref:Uncharacterized protein n=1 Tax=Gonapodya prolifera (strain JEL478) TaxID=1344416 RepID=A0A138ZXP0_GONPJ|nr:hypothetical protein M427DRAFT_39199 [Gonapodya prolifera JEL478]|eukprot:KXS09272.1 hypothetical protein M427DRAFT_39199 [Gonapodya prolifera JEL478]
MTLDRDFYNKVESVAKTLTKNLPTASLASYAATFNAAPTIMRDVLRDLEVFATAVGTSSASSSSAVWLGDSSAKIIMSSASLSGLYEALQKWMETKEVHALSFCCLFLSPIKMCVLSPIDINVSVAHILGDVWGVKIVAPKDKNGDKKQHMWGSGLDFSIDYHS